MTWDRKNLLFFVLIVATSSAMISNEVRRARLLLGNAFGPICAMNSRTQVYPPQVGVVRSKYGITHELIHAKNLMICSCSSCRDRIFIPEISKNSIRYDVVVIKLLFPKFRKILRARFLFYIFTIYMDWNRAGFWSLPLNTSQLNPFLISSCHDWFDSLAFLYFAFLLSSHVLWRTIFAKTPATDTIHALNSYTRLPDSKQYSR